MYTAITTRSSHRVEAICSFGLLYRVAPTIARSGRVGAEFRNCGGTCVGHDGASRPEASGLFSSGGTPIRPGRPYSECHHGRAVASQNSTRTFNCICRGPLIA